jgi:2-methylcitrate dehydratase PrpD
MSKASISALPSDTLATYITNTRYEQLPPEVVHEAIRSILNWVGVSIGGSTHETMQIAVKAYLPLAGSPVASVLGRAERMDIARAALLNGISSHVLDFDDTHPETLLHPSAPVAAAVFALGEMLGSTGREIINAFVTGVEVECRVAYAVSPGHYATGWHATGSIGVFGAAAAAARLLELNATQTKYALGIAATQSAGLREMFGTMCKSLNPGKAAENGLCAALLAAGGFTSAEAPIEGNVGFANVLAPTRNLTELTRELGTTYHLLGNTYKAFACGIVIHPAIDGCIRIRNRSGRSAESIDAIKLRAHPLTLTLTGKLTPHTGLEGKFSVFHSAAAAYIDGACGEAQYHDERVQGSEVIALRDKVSMDTDESLRLEEVYVDILFSDGATESVHVEHCVGSLANPMSDAALDAKFMGLCEGVIPAQQATLAIAALRALDRLDSLAKLMPLLCQG